MHRPIRITILSLAAVALVACGASDQAVEPTVQPDDVVFSVDPALIGDVYENRAIG
jgi:hypothetical protein